MIRGGFAKRVAARFAIGQVIQLEECLVCNQDAANSNFALSICKMPLAFYFILIRMG